MELINLHIGGYYVEINDGGPCFSFSIGHIHIAVGRNEGIEDKSPIRQEYEESNVGFYHFWLRSLTMIETGSKPLSGDLG